jgi:hypothetical protein
MKKRKAPKLSLRKDTISNLTNGQLKQVNGGAPPTQNRFCPTPATRCFICPPLTFDGQCTIVI